MFRNNIAFKGICAIILFITMGVSQVSLEIQNVTASTLDIYMTNTAGCSSCDDNGFDNQVGCEVSGNNTAGGVWTFDASINEATCTAWDSDTEVGTHGIYFDGAVAGFEFYLKGVTIEGVSGGTADEYLDYVSFKLSTSKILGATFTSSTIPVGSGVLTTISFSDAESETCFVTHGCVKDGVITYDLATCPAGEVTTQNIISDSEGIPVTADWSNCWCGLENGNDQYSDNCDACDSDTSNDCVPDCTTKEMYDADNADCTGTWYEEECWGGSNEDYNGDEIGCGECDGYVDCTFACIAYGSTDGAVFKDNCGVCGGDNTACCSGDGVADCNGVCDGPSVADDCGVCDGDNAPLTGTCDCAGTPYGNAVRSGCDNVCNSTAEEDCTGLCAGTTTEEYCDACASQYFDCAGVCDGPLPDDPDECGVCDAEASNDNTPLTGTCDCAGTPNGIVVVDDCGVCDGDNAPLTGTCDCAGTPNGIVVVDCAGDCDGDTEDYNGDETGCGEMGISQIGYNLPEEFSISQNFPNPFNPITSITFDVAKMDEVSLVVYDLTGKEVITLVSGTYTPGTYNVEWNAVNNTGDGIVSGMYIYRYISSETAITRKMLYLK